MYAPYFTFYFIVHFSKEK